MALRNYVNLFPFGACFRQESKRLSRTPPRSVFLVWTAAAMTAAAAQERAPSPAVNVENGSVPRAFLKERHLRLYPGGEGEREYFTAEWHEARARGQEFSYQAVTLKRRTSSRTLPAVSSSWREIKVLDLAQGKRLQRALADKLAPAQQGHAAYVQYALGDVTLFRDSTGKVQVVPFEATPAEITIDRRYNRQEFSSAAAALLEKELRANHPNVTAFVLHWRRDGHLRTAFLDLVERETVVLFPPDADTEGRPKLGGSLTALTSFVLIDNLWAFLKNPVSSATRTI